MFSPSFNTRHVLQHRNQPPSNLPKHKKFLRRTSLNLSIIAEDSSSQSHSRDGLLHDNNAKNRPMSSSRAGRLLQSCSGLEEVRKTHAFVLKLVTDRDPFVSNNLISVYVKFGDLAAARQVFDNMNERSIVSWTAMLDGYRKQHCTHYEALNLFVDLLESGSHANAHTYVCLFNLCSRTSEKRFGRQLHARVVKARASNIILDCSILHFYSKSGELTTALDLFDRMGERDLISWTTMITACSQHGRGRESFNMLSRMISSGVQPNEFTICSVLNACGEERELKFGKQLHGIVVKKNAYGSDVYLGTALVDFYGKCQETEDARRVFDGMKIRNEVTWTAIIAAYTRNNSLAEAAIALFRKMLRLRVPDNDLTMVSLIQACGFLGALRAGKELHARVLKDSLQENNIFIGNVLVWLYSKCGAHTHAFKVLKRLPEKDVVSWTTIISSCAGLGHEQAAIGYLKSMMGHGVEPNSFTYSSALKACAKLADVRYGRLVHSSVNKSPAALANVFVGSALVHMYSRCGHLPEAALVFDGMPERNRVSWQAMVVAYARNGLCSEALRLVYRMRAEGVEVDDYVLSTVISACGDFKWEEMSSKDVVLQI
ncbi:Pentatricopeptide repeat-containing protein [Striga hermonthica]|uniref:Pentatricopeptide repeat-containing protein n=1 Tax=Striga hermonthica TaxID=68872 RepID=A0A9N7RKP4_STRHE|nr:Pentatricopeptide repeat-containing protein [Striga hermonthica]